MKKLIDKLVGEVNGWENAGDVKAILGQMEKAASGNKLTRLFRKHDEFSITRALLILSWTIGLCLYVCGALFAGVVVPFIEATVPAFSSGDFLAVTGAASALYYANHNISVGKK